METGGLAPQTIPISNFSRVRTPVRLVVQTIRDPNLPNPSFLLPHRADRIRDPRASAGLAEAIFLCFAVATPRAVDPSETRPLPSMDNDTGRGL